LYQSRAYLQRFPIGEVNAGSGQPRVSHRIFNLFRITFYFNHTLKQAAIMMVHVISAEQNLGKSFHFDFSLVPQLDSLASGNGEHGGCRV
jgi:hypothetical protein